MQFLAMSLALAGQPLPATALPAGVFVAILAEKASGFKTLAECEQAIALAPKVEQERLVRLESNRGSLFNRAAGNTTRCEIVDGEPLIVVVPKGI